MCLNHPWFRLIEKVSFCRKKPFKKKVDHMLKDKKSNKNNNTKNDNYWSHDYNDNANHNKDYNNTSKIMKISILALVKQFKRAILPHDWCQQSMSFQTRRRRTKQERNQVLKKHLDFVPKMAFSNGETELLWGGGARIKNGENKQINKIRQNQ